MPKHTPAERKRRREEAAARARKEAEKKKQQKKPSRTEKFLASILPSELVKKLRGARAGERGEGLNVQDVEARRKLAEQAAQDKAVKEKEEKEERERKERERKARRGGSSHNSSHTILK